MRATALTPLAPHPVGRSRAGEAGGATEGEAVGPYGAGASRDDFARALPRVPDGVLRTR
ncbi:hypothetical protein GCM10023336_20580 [Streptomyces similanensis]|uniref:Uncharacterized protein n=1 Tax=Streptomyces similanensis TaxID=1274988 RepID=A0ABP9K8P3_9ACTN